MKLINSIRKCFTQAPNALAVDQSLCDGSVRVFLYMCGRPDDWQFNNADIQNRLGIKRAETIAKYWKELIETGWIARQPKLTANGKPSGYFDYILNFKPVKPTPYNPDKGTTKKVEEGTPDKPDTHNQQIRKNSSDSNNDVSSTNNDQSKNTPPPDTNNVVGVYSWLKIAEHKNLIFEDNEQKSVVVWLKYLFSNQHQISDLQIETILNRLFKLKSSGYDICSMVDDTVEAGLKWLLKPTPIYLKKIPAQTAKAFTANPKPHQYDNNEYFFPENPTEKNELTSLIIKWYQNKINPKTGKNMTEAENKLIQNHEQLCSNKLGTGPTKWHQYVLENEVQKYKSLLEQDANDSMLTLSKTSNSLLDFYNDQKKHNKVIL